MFTPRFGLLCAALALGFGCDGSGETVPETAPKHEADPAGIAPTKAPMTEGDFERRTEIWRDRLSEDPTLPMTARFFEAKAELTRVANEASDVHLRANASLLLGLMFEARDDRTAAIAAYQQAAKLVTDDAGPYMALALALAAEKKYVAAAEAQKTATALDPDNLENWLVLGEVLVKSGDEKAGIAAYVDYEKRRKGLIDGLTLKAKSGDYLIGAEERAGCAEALASATDQGTTVALTYAFKTDPEAIVRSTAASVMGVQRLSIYATALRAAMPDEKDSGAKESIVWALGEIERDPVTPKPLELPPEVTAELASDAKPDAGEAPTEPGDAPAKPTDVGAKPVEAPAKPVDAPTP